MKMMFGLVFIFHFSLQGPWACWSLTELENNSFKATGLTLHLFLTSMLRWYKIFDPVMFLPFSFTWYMGTWWGWGPVYSVNHIVVFVDLNYSFDFAWQLASKESESKSTSKTDRFLHKRLSEHSTQHNTSAVAQHFLEYEHTQYNQLNDLPSSSNISASIKNLTWVSLLTPINF